MFLVIYTVDGMHVHVTKMEGKKNPEKVVLYFHFLFSVIKRKVSVRGIVVAQFRCPCLA